jgi:hypothetical protein
MTTMNATTPPTRRVRADDARHLRIDRDSLKVIATALAAFAAGGGITLSVTGPGTAGATVTTHGQAAPVAPVSSTKTDEAIVRLLEEFREFRTETRGTLAHIQAKASESNERIARLEGWWHAEKGK